MSRKIVAGNWKMNKTFDESKGLVDELNSKMAKVPADVRLIIAPPSIYLSTLSEKANSSLRLSAQNCTDQDFGAYTGEISAPMISSLGINYCLVGHSERRSYYGDTDEWISRKVISLITNSVNPIFCCGEVLEERNANKYFEVVKRQIEIGVFHLSSEDFSNVIIAYEPVWAIGTGVTASPEQAQEMHSYIRSLIEEKYGESIAESTSLLYGGSCKPSNASELFSQKDIDGGLIGGASLNADDFIAIAQAN